MRVAMDVRRRGAQFTGMLTRVSDHVSVPFWGVLELVAAIEQLQPEEGDVDSEEADIGETNPPPAHPAHRDGRQQ